MRIINDEEFLEWCGEHTVKNCRETRMMVSEGEEIREVSICEDCRAKAQHQQDLKDFKEWLLEHRETSLWNKHGNAYISPEEFEAYFKEIE